MIILAEDLKFLYLTRGLTHLQIAQELGVSHRCIGKYLKKLGVPARPLGSWNIGKRSPMWRGGITRLRSGRVRVWRPDHPRASSNGYIHRAIIVWEEANGR